MLIAHGIRLHQIISGSWKALFSVVVTCVATYYVNTYILMNFLHIPGLVPTILGTALAFFIGFNNNQAYDRWWEARKIWGSLVNDSRTWARQLLYYSTSDNTVSKDFSKIRRGMILRHLAFVYALKQNLRRSKENVYKGFLSEEDAQRAGSTSNQANTILEQQSANLQEMYTEKEVDGFIFHDLNNTLTRFCEQMGQCERIRNTVFPTTYNFYTRIFVYIFIIFEILGTTESIGYWSILSGILIGYIFLTTQTIGLALLNPFDLIVTGLPLDQIARTIEINLLEMLHESDIPKPIEAVNGEYVM